MSLYNDFLADASRSADVVVAAVADNCRFDERASEDRWRKYEDLLPDPPPSGGTITWRDWTAAHRLHSQQTCKVASPSVPDAFLEVNQPAWLEGLSENQTLVRIEDLSAPLRIRGLRYNALEDLWRRARSGNSDAELAIQSILEDWNQVRDARPAFATFSDEVQDELDDDDWPHALRDRLGLGHYGHPGGIPQPIALMRYSLADVLATGKKLKLATACALPTVLDDGMHEFFFPVPREHAYGATMHLVPKLAAILTAEVVHCRIDYEPRHLFRLGQITRAVSLDDSQLREVRDLHLLALQVECGRDDFGEELEGRT